MGDVKLESAEALAHRLCRLAIPEQGCGGWPSVRDELNADRLALVRAVLEHLTGTEVDDAEARRHYTALVEPDGGTT